MTRQKVVDGRSAGKIEGKVAVEDVVYPAKSERAGEIIIESGPADHQERRGDHLHAAA